jgi:CheY-like chemotaxis protein
MDKLKVLVADDEASVRLTVSKLLGEEFTVLQAIDGKEAIAITLAEKPDIVLLDVMMPNIDGYTACSTIKQEKATKAIPVVMLTALDFDLNRELAIQIGANAYITKPFLPEDLRSTVRLLTKPAS